MLEHLKGKKIAVILGGLSREKEISKRSGSAILTSLEKQGYNALAIDGGFDLVETLVREKPDAAIIALHGRYGEDGTVQGVLEMMRIPYSGSGVAASAICMDKILTKRLVSTLGIKVPMDKVISDPEEAASAVEGFSMPVVVKPNREGSTIGMQVVREKKDLKGATSEALRYDDTILVEQYIAGTEVTVGIINGRSLPVLEVVPRKGFYDYEAKYTKGMTEYIVPARIPEGVAGILQENSKRISDCLGLSGVARLDFIVKEGTPYFLEVNTIPGMTETSLVPKAAAYIGISFDGVVEAMLKTMSLET